ncbi:cation-transporting P-type ATPase, partial [Haladaptatus sp. W1]
MSSVTSSETTPTEWHSVPGERVFEALDSDENGLSTDEASERLSEFGP